MRSRRGDHLPAARHQRGRSPGLPVAVVLGRIGRSGLYDNTAGLTLLALASVIAASYVYLSRSTSTHLYTLYRVGAQRSDPSHDATLTLTPGPASVPESGSTLTFFVVGLGAVLLVARSQTFRPSN